jgi:hypothetical protein
MLNAHLGSFASCGGFLLSERCGHPTDLALGHGQCRVHSPAMKTAEVPSTADIVDLPWGPINPRSVDVAFWDKASMLRSSAKQRFRKSALREPHGHWWQNPMTVPPRIADHDCVRLRFALKTGSCRRLSEFSACQYPGPDVNGHNRPLGRTTILQRTRLQRQSARTSRSRAGPSGQCGSSLPRCDSCGLRGGSRGPGLRPRTAARISISSSLHRDYDDLKICHS